MDRRFICRRVRFLDHVYHACDRRWTHKLDGVDPKTGELLEVGRWCAHCYWAIVEGEKFARARSWQFREQCRRKKRAA